MPDGYEIRRIDDFETLEGSGRREMVARCGAAWTCRRFGMNIVEIPAGSAIVEHDETASGQVEVYAILEGEGVFLVGRRGASGAGRHLGPVRPGRQAQHPQPLRRAAAPRS